MATSISGIATNWLSGILPRLTAVPAFSNIEKTGRIIIENCDLLETVAGMFDHVAVLDDSLRVTGNANLQYLGTFGELRLIGRRLMLEDNGKLANIDELKKLTRVGSSLTIRNNPALTDLNGLDGLESVGDWLDIYRNANLVSVTGLGHLTEVGGNLTIIDNDNLVSLAGFDDLEYIGWYLHVGDNAKLDRLGLGAIRTVRGRLRILNNPQLAVTHACDLADQLTVGEGTDIANNKCVTQGGKQVCDCTK